MAGIAVLTSQEPGDDPLAAHCLAHGLRVFRGPLDHVLERYRLANGHFPETLEALAPRLISPLPNDVLTGEPYKYRLRDDGRFVLYSIGWDEKDDGGVAGKSLFNDQQGDWVWEYPAK